MFWCLPIFVPNGRLVLDMLLLESLGLVVTSSSKLDPKMVIYKHWATYNSEIMLHIFITASQGIDI
jgi:hypothetical protein